VRKRKLRTKPVLKYFCLIIIVGIFLFPVIYMIMNSVMSTREIINSYNTSVDNFAKLKLIPEKFTLEQYYQAFFRRPTFLNMFWNSMILTLPIVTFQFLISCFAAFAFSKFKFPGRDKIFFVLIILLIMPLQVTLVPNYIVLDKFNLLNTISGIVIPGSFSAFGICLLRQNMRYVPNDTIEAAKSDGASYFKILFRIVLPQIKGGLAALLILVFIDNWNMVEQPLIYLRDKLKYPLSIYLSEMGNSDVGIVFACGVIFMVPALIIFFIFEEEFVSESIVK